MLDVARHARSGGTTTVNASGAYKIAQPPPPPPPPPIAISSTSNTSAAFGGMSSPAPSAPYLLNQYKSKSNIRDASARPAAAAPPPPHP